MFFVILDIFIHVGFTFNIITCIFRMMIEFMICLVKGDSKFLESYIYFFLLFSSMILKIILPSFINLVGEIPDISNFYFNIFHPFRILESYSNSLLLISLIYFFSLNLNVEKKRRSLVFLGIIIFVTLVFVPIMFAYFVGYVMSILLFSFISPFVVDIFMWGLFFFSGLVILLVMYFTKQEVKETESLVQHEVKENEVLIQHEGDSALNPKFSNFQFLWMSLLLFFGLLLFVESVLRLVLILLTLNLKDKSNYFLPFGVVRSSGYIFLFLFYLVVAFGKSHITKMEKNLFKLNKS
jgi:hypothetical protein